MNVKELLESLGIDSEIADKASKQIKTEIGKEFVAKDQYNKKAGTISELEEKIKDLEGKNVDLESQVGKYSNLKADYDNLVTEHNNYKKDVETKELNSTKLSKLKETLKGEGFNDKIIPLLTKEFDLNSLELEEDKIKGWDEVSKGVKENYKDFISQTSVEGAPSANPINNQETGQDTFLNNFKNI